MSRVYRPEYTSPVPATAKVVTRQGKRYAEYRVKGKLVRWPVREIHGRLRVVVTVDRWYCEYDDHRGKTRRVKGYRDRRATEALLLKLLQEDERRRSGLRQPDQDDAKRPLLDLLEEYISYHEAKGSTPAARAYLRHHCTTICSECRWHVWSDIRADDAVRFLSRHMKLKKLSPATINAYAVSIKMFVKWLGKRVGAHSPLADDALPMLTEETDRRRSRRILTDDELAQLFNHLDRGIETHRRRVIGPLERAMLYRLAAYTGLRAGELYVLRPEWFHLDATPPHVAVPAGNQKARRADLLPIPAHLVPRLREWLRGKKPGQRIWPGRAAFNAFLTRRLRADLKDAGVSELDSRGQRAIMHGLRRGYVTRLIRSGADVEQVTRLARHQAIKTTLDYYVNSDLADLARVLDGIPEPGKP